MFSNSPRLNTINAPRIGALTIAIRAFCKAKTVFALGTFGIGLLATAFQAADAQTSPNAGNMGSNAQPANAKVAALGLVNSALGNTGLGLAGLEGGIGTRNGSTTIGLKLGKDWDDTTALVGEAVLGRTHREAQLNFGLRLSPQNTLVITHQEIRQRLDFNFALGASGQTAARQAWAAQTTTGLTLKHSAAQDDSALVQSMAVTAYRTRSAGQNFGAQEFSQVQANLYQLFSQQLQTYGITRTGITGALDLQITRDLSATVRGGVIAQQAHTFVAAASQVRPSLGTTVNYQLDAKNALLAQFDASVLNTNASLKWTHAINPTTRLGFEAFAARPQVGLPVQGVRVGITISDNFDGLPARGANVAAATPSAATAPRPRQSLLAATSASPFYRSMGVEVAVDTTVKPLLLVSVDQIGLPTGASIDPATGNINYPVPALLGTFVSAVNTTSGAAVPGSVFAINGGVLTIQTRALEPFLVAGVQTIAATFTGGVLNIVAQKGSVKILSITFTPTAAAAAAAPAAPAGLAFNTAAATNNTRPALSWGAVVGATSYSVRINAGAWVDVGNVTSYQLPVQTDGVKTLQVQANKLVGATVLASAASAAAVVTVDTVAPTLTSVSLADWLGNAGTAGTALFTMSEPITSITSVVMKFTTGPTVGATVPGINLTSAINASQVTVTPVLGSGSGTTLGVRIEITGTDAAGNTFTVTTVGFGIG